MQVQRGGIELERGDDVFRRIPHRVRIIDAERGDELPDLGHQRWMNDILGFVAIEFALPLKLFSQFFNIRLHRPESVKKPFPQERPTN